MKQFLILILFLIITAGQGLAAELTILSGAGLIKPMEELVQSFEKKEGVKTRVHYGSSGEIFAMVASKRPCDVLIPGAEKYTQDALKNGWVIKDTIHKLVLHTPVIAVPAGNPAGIQGLSDLANPGVKVAIGDPKAPAIGRVAKKMLIKASLWDPVQPNIKTFAPTVNQLLIYVALKQVDAAIIWEDLTSWAEGRDKIEVVQIPKKENLIKTIPTAVCTNAPNKEMALKFNTYIASREGLEIWEKWGFSSCAEK
jgi:molybdate transport system substrate-binding protein